MIHFVFDSENVYLTDLTISLHGTSSVSNTSTATSLANSSSWPLSKFSLSTRVKTKKKILKISKWNSNRHYIASNAPLLLPQDGCIQIQHKNPSYTKRITIQIRKIVTKEVTTANQIRGKYHKGPMRIQSKLSEPKAIKNFFRHSIKSWWIVWPRGTVLEKPALHAIIFSTYLFMNGLNWYHSSLCLKEVSVFILF